MYIGLYGGSFNPPHIGHELVIYYLLHTAEVDEVWLIPTFKHAFGKALAPFEERLEMCRLMARSFSGRVRVSEVEREQEGVSYTIDTVCLMLKRFPEHRFDWIVGADILAETERWKDFDRLRELVGFRVLGRSGYPGGGGLVMPEVSSSEVRNRLAQGQSASELVSKGVLEYIDRRGLYRG